MERPELDRGAGRERALERQTDRAVERPQERPQRAEPRERFRERWEAQREEQRRDSDRPRAERQQREDAVRERKRQAEQDRERERAANQAEERRAREEERRRAERDKAREAEERKLREEEHRQAERDRDRRRLEDRAGLKEDRERAEREFQRERERLRLSDRERTRIRDIIVLREHGVLRDIDFPISVGVHVPQHVRLHPIPVDLVEVVPAYRSYRYFIVEDYICIVDPETYVILQVIDKKRPAAELAVLDLTEWEREHVRRHVSWEDARADVRIRLALGVDIPSGVELHGFSDEILSDIPKLRRYRYVVVEDDVVICDPESRDVVLVVSS